MTNKVISEIPLFDPILPKMDCPLFGVTTVFISFLISGVNQCFLELEWTMTAIHTTRDNGHRHGNGTPHQGSGYPCLESRLDSQLMILANWQTPDHLARSQLTTSWKQLLQSVVALR